MAHKEQQEFVKNVKNNYPEYFKNKKVLNIGSYDVNGGERHFFENCDFIGLDLEMGPGVDIVCPAQDYMGPSESFDTIISCECFEHNPFYSETLKNIVRLLKPNGLFLFTCAYIGRPVHGIKSMEVMSQKKYNNWVTMPNVIKENWDNEYYKNLNEDDIRKSIDVDLVFKTYNFEINHTHFDLYFYGIKK